MFRKHQDLIKIGIIITAMPAFSFRSMGRAYNVYNSNIKNCSFFLLQRALHPPEVKHERLFIVSVLGFFVNLIGIFVFQHGGASGTVI